MVKLFSKNSNLCDHNSPTSQTDRQTTCDRNTALCTKVYRAVKTRKVLLFSCYGSTQEALKSLKCLGYTTSSRLLNPDAVVVSRSRVRTCPSVFAEALLYMTTLNLDLYCEGANSRRYYALCIGLQCESKKIPPLRFSEIFSQTVGNF